MDRFIREYESEYFDTKLIQITKDFGKCILENDFSVMHMNVRSMSMNFEEFRLYLLYMAVKFDVIVLTETYKVASLEMFHIDGYTIIYNEGDYNKNDGVVVYLRQYMKFNAKTVQIADTKVLDIDICEKEKLKITAIYRSPHSCPNVFNVGLLEYLKKN